MDQLTVTEQPFFQGGQFISKFSKAATLYSTAYLNLPVSTSPKLQNTEVRPGRLNTFDVLAQKVSVSSLQSKSSSDS